ncbi:MAG: VWA domain-containing protein, partial [Succinivibrio sp.]
MLRIYRCKEAEVAPEVLRYAPHALAFENEIASRFGADYTNLMARPEISGGYVSFYTNLSGESLMIDDSNKEHYQAELNEYEKKRQTVLNYFKNNKQKLSDESLAPYVSDYIKLVDGENQIYLVNRNPILIPKSSIQRVKAVPLAVPPAAGRHGCLFPFLALLALLILLFLLWWFLLRPWPMSGNFLDTLKSRFGADAEAPFVIPEDHESQLEELLSSQEDEIKEREEQQKAQEQARLKALEEEKARLKALEEEEARLKALEEEKARLKALEEEKAKAEAKRKALEEAKLKAAKEKAEREALEKAKKEALAKKKPKCRMLKEQGTMPQLVIAFDGSESMTLPYGAVSRLVAAKTAARDLIDSVDKNVSIGLIEINGCPASKNRGFFAPSKRSALKQKISSINPYQFDGKTPLVHGLRQIEQLSDGVKSEAVGILISDGEDTCPFTNAMNVCTIANMIHNKKPKLIIHTILIGDSIDSAACIARNTGGKVFKPKDAGQIETFIKQAGASLKNV